MINLLNKDINLVSGGAVCTTKNGLKIKKFDFSINLTEAVISSLAKWCCEEEQGEVFVTGNLMRECKHLIHNNYKLEIKENTIINVDKSNKRYSHFGFSTSNIQ